MAYNKETQMYEGYIYIIYNDIYPEKVYIGQTIRTLERRWYDHTQQVRDHDFTDKLHNAMKSHGIEHFGMELLSEYKFKTKEELLKILNYEERRFIELYDSYKNGYNATKGGNDTSHQNRAVSKYDLYGNYLSSYESINDLLKEFNAVHCIYECCSGKCKYAYGYIWRYIEDGLDKYEIPNENEIKEGITRIKTLSTIYKYDYKGNFLCSFKNIDDACIKEGIKYSRIYKCCTGQTHLVNKCVYRFYDESFDKYPTKCKSNNIIEQYDLDWNFINYFQVNAEASKATGISKQAIGRVCRGDSVSGIAGGYRWKYA